MKFTDFFLIGWRYQFSTIKNNFLVGLFFVGEVHFYTHWIIVLNQKYFHTHLNSINELHYMINIIMYSSIPLLENKSLKIKKNSILQVT